MLHPQVPRHKHHPFCQVSMIIHIIIVAYQSIEHVPFEILQEIHFVGEFFGVGVDMVVPADDVAGCRGLDVVEVPVQGVNIDFIQPCHTRDIVQSLALPCNATLHLLFRRRQDQRR